MTSRMKITGMLAALSLAATAPLGFATTADVETVVAQALSRNQELLAAGQAWQAAKERRPQVTKLPEPRLQYTEYVETVETRVGPQERALALTQSVPWFGTLGLRGDVADIRADVARARMESVRLRVIRDVRRACHDLILLERTIGVTREHRDLLAGWEAVVRTRYAAGSSTYADLVRTQVEITKLDDRLAELDDRRRPLAATLNAVLDLPADTAPPVFDASPVAAAGVDLDDSTLRTRLEADNPELAGLGLRADGHRLAGRLAGKQRLPELTFGLSVIRTGSARMPGVQGSGKDPLLATLAVSLPLWRGAYGAAEREADGNYRATRALRRDRADALAARLESALFARRDAVRKIDLYGGVLLVKARQSLAATRAAYEAGDSGFIDVIDAERLLLEFELSREGARRDLAVAVADIEMLIGGPVADDPFTD